MKQKIKRNLRQNLQQNLKQNGSWNFLRNIKRTKISKQNIQRKEQPIGKRTKISKQNIQRKESWIDLQKIPQKSWNYCRYCSCFLVQIQWIAQPIGKQTLSVKLMRVLKRKPSVKPIFVLRRKPSVKPIFVLKRKPKQTVPTE